MEGRKEIRKERSKEGRTKKEGNKRNTEREYRKKINEGRMKEE